MFLVDAAKSIVMNRQQSFSVTAWPSHQIRSRPSDHGSIGRQYRNAARRKKLPSGAVGLCWYTPANTYGLMFASRLWKNPFARSRTEGSSSPS